MPAIIFGDYNTDALSARLINRQLFDLFVPFGGDTMIHAGTSITNTCEFLNGSCFTYKLGCAVDTVVLLSFISGDLAIFIFFPPLKISRIRSSAAATVRYTRIDESNTPVFQGLIAVPDWSDLLQTEDSGTAYDIFTQKITELYAESFPII